MKAWEYLIEDVPAARHKFEELLAQSGDAGWEAVGVWTIPGDARIHSSAPRHLILFKRPNNSKWPTTSKAGKLPVALGGPP